MSYTYRVHCLLPDCVSESVCYPEDGSREDAVGTAFPRAWFSRWVENCLYNFTLKMTLDSLLMRCLLLV